MPVIVTGGPYDELRALSRRCKGRRVLILHQLRLALDHAVPYLPHGPQDGAFRLIRCQQLQAVLRRQLDVDTEPVRQQSQLPYQLRRGAGNGLGMDIPIEPVLLPQDAQRPDHLFRGIVRAAQHTAGQEQPLDIVPPVETNGQLRQFPRRERRPPRIVAAPVDAVFTVEGADVGHQHLQQCDAPPISGEAVAAPGDRGGRIADHTGSGAAPHTAGGAGRIILGGIRQDGQLLQNVHRFTPCGVCGEVPAGRCSR